MASLRGAGELHDDEGSEYTAKISEDVSGSKPKLHPPARGMRRQVTTLASHEKSYDSIRKSNQRSSRIGM